MLALLIMAFDRTAHAGTSIVTVKNRRGDVITQKSGAVIESADTVFFYLNQDSLSDTEVFAQTISFDGGENFGALTEVEDGMTAVTPEEGSICVVRFYVCDVSEEGSGKGDASRAKNPAGGEQIYTVTYAPEKEDSILASFAGNFVKQKDGVEYYSKNAPMLNLYPSQSRAVYVTVDDGKERREYTVKEKMLSLKFAEGTYHLDVFALAGEKRVHAKGFPRTICYDAKAPSLPAFTIHIPTDGRYDAEEKKYYASGSLTVSVKCTDQGSGVEKIFMKLPKGEEKETDSIQVMAPFSGTVYAKCVDAAGNESPWVQCAEKLIVESKAPEITAHMEQEEEKMHLYGKITDETGILEAKITCRGETLYSYAYTEGDRPAKEKEFSLYRVKEHISYEEQEIVIKAADLAGNRSEKRIRTGKKDTTPPLISIEGCSAYDVTREDVYLRFQVTDDHLKPSGISGEAVRSDSEGRILETEKLTFPETVFTKEGDYAITVTAEDSYGNTAKRSWNFTIDKSAPIISGIQEYDGKTLSEFLLKQDMASFFSDFSGVTYRAYLNGRDYDENQPVDEPGTYVFRVMAEDEAGNAGTAQVKFSIEPPSALPVSYEKKKTEINRTVAGKEQKSIIISTNKTADNTQEDEKTEKEAQTGKTEKTVKTGIVAGVLLLLFTGIFLLRSLTRNKNKGMINAMVQRFGFSERFGCENGISEEDKSDTDWG